MDERDPIRRRALLAAFLAAPALAAWAGAAAESGSPAAGSGGRRLMAYFTRSGNTRVIAGTIARMIGTDLFEIRAAVPYPEDYEATVEQARRERDRGFAPDLAATVPDIAGYDAIFLGFPIWGGTAPPIIRSFLAAHALGGRTIHPVITHGGYGAGDSLDILKRHAPQARIAAPFILEADQERRTIEQVGAWLKKIGAS